MLEGLLLNRSTAPRVRLQTSSQGQYPWGQMEKCHGTRLAQLTAWENLNGEQTSLLRGKVEPARG